MPRLAYVAMLGVCVCMSVAVAADTDAPPLTLQTPEPWENRSFWFIGTSNYHLRLRESEQKVDTMINGTLGLVIPGWQEPKTFKDWSDDFMIWDLWAGYGRDINAKWSWSVYGGGGAGTVKNADLYFPLSVDIEFYRMSLLAGSSVSWYPWGKPVKGGRGVVESLRAGRPMVEMNVGYTYQISDADVYLSLPLLRKFIHIPDHQTYHLMWVSPRVGAEFPITNDTSLNVLTGMTFFHKHADEFNHVLLEFFIRHRF
jgi:hypothetical protein